MNAKSLQAKLQKMGATLSAMVMPNVGVFIGWGVLAALFISTGWIPNEYWNALVSPILTYLMPVLIGYTGGFNVYGKRGGVIGAFATMGTIVGSDVTMLVGGMIMGPLAAWCLKKFDKAVEGKVRPGLEMLVDNFSLGFIGLALCMLGYAAVAPAMTAIQNVLAAGIDYMTEHNLLLLTPLFVQPAQILFLNNAINHGILIPLGIQQAAETGKSILFLIEANGAYWVGLVAAFAVFGHGTAKKSAPGAVIIQFFGGIAETCFPYCLSQPLTILGPMAGNVFSIFVLTTFGGGAVGPVSPGSVFAYYMMTPKSCILVNTIAYFGSMLVSFAVTGLIIKLSKSPASDEEERAADSTQTGNVVPVALTEGKAIASLDKVIFACDAGMGSSAMGVSILRTRLQKNGLFPQIDHVAVADIPDDADVVVTNINLYERAKNTARPDMPILTITNFMDQGEYDRIVADIKKLMEQEPAKAPEAKEIAAPTVKALRALEGALPVFSKNNVVLGATIKNQNDAIDACADLLIHNGYADEAYRQDMHERAEDVSVYLGNGVALPHGLASSKERIQNSGICFVQVPEGVDFDGETAYLLIGVAGRGEEHVDILGQIATILCDESNIQALRKATTKDEVMQILKVDLGEEPQAEAELAMAF